MWACTILFNVQLKWSTIVRLPSFRQNDLRTYVIGLRADHGQLVEPRTYCAVTVAAIQGDLDGNRTKVHRWTTERDSAYKLRNWREWENNDGVGGYRLVSPVDLATNDGAGMHDPSYRGSSENKASREVADGIRLEFWRSSRYVVMSSRKLENVTSERDNPNNRYRYLGITKACCVAVANLRVARINTHWSLISHVLTHVT